MTTKKKAATKTPRPPGLVWVVMFGTTLRAYPTKRAAVADLTLGEVVGPYTLCERVAR